MSGNLIRKESKTGGDYIAFEYGPFDALEKALIYEAGALAREVSYGYDGNGRRIWKRVDEKSGGGASNVLKFVYNEDDAAAEFNGDGVMLANYLFAPGVDEPLMVDRAGGSYYYHQDNIHSVILITDDDGDVVNEYDYDSYGNILRIECPALNLSPPKPCIPNRFAYTGRELEPEIGMYHYRRRTYNPDTGVFTSEDQFPIIPEEAFDVNRYNFVRNNPIALLDPFGKKSCSTKGKCDQKAYDTCMLGCYMAVGACLEAYAHVEIVCCEAGAGIGCTVCGLSIAGLCGTTFYTCYKACKDSYLRCPVKETTR